MISVRIKYAKGESVKYVSHLDTLKTFTRAARRADLPLKYSQGFNPHPHMVFGLPSSVGIISVSEYADIDFEDGVTCQKIQNGLNACLPDGFRVLDCYERELKSNIMADIVASEYVIYIKAGKTVLDIQDSISHFISLPAVLVMKKSKKGEKETDIKPMIHFISAGEDNEGTYLITKIAAGNQVNLKPSLLIDAMNMHADANIAIQQIIRTELFLK